MAEVQDNPQSLWLRREGGDVLLTYKEVVFRVDILRQRGFVPATQADVDRIGGYDQGIVPFEP